MSAGGVTLFSPRIIAAVVAASMIAFVLFLWLSAHAGDDRDGRNGGAHALSNGATGFRGLGDLLDATGGKAVRVRDKRGLGPPGLLVLTPTTNTDPARLAAIVKQRTRGRTLIILPKWATKPLEAGQGGRQGWVSSFGPGYAAGRLAGAMSEKAVSVTVSEPLLRGKPAPRGEAFSRLVGDFSGPMQPQTIMGPDVEPIVTSDNSEGLVARLRSNPRVFIAADPDIFNNMGLRDLATARAAIGLMDHMTEAADRRVTFDLTLNGFESGPSNLLKLAFEPPFGAATLCLLVAAALAALGAFFPFGPAIREARAIGFGTGALVANSADMLVGAGRDRLVADRYLALTRDAAAARIGLPAGLDAMEATAHLDRLSPLGGRSFADLAADLATARGHTGIAAAAAALHRWKKELA